MTYLRHRLKDDYLLMNKAATYSDIYEKMSLTMYTVIYKDGEKLLQEPERLQSLVNLYIIHRRYCIRILYRKNPLIMAISVYVVDGQ